VVRAEKLQENMGVGIDFIWLPKFQGNSSVVEEEFKVGLWRLNMWLEHFIYVWYLECVIHWDCFSSCVLIALGEDECV
jgi:hypothetical protein